MSDSMPIVDRVLQLAASQKETSAHTEWVCTLETERIGNELLDVICQYPKSRRPLIAVALSATLEALERQMSAEDKALEETIKGISRFVAMVALGDSLEKRDEVTSHAGEAEGGEKGR